MNFVQFWHLWIFTAYEHHHRSTAAKGAANGCVWCFPPLSHLDFVLVVAGVAMASSKGISLWTRAARWVYKTRVVQHYKAKSDKQLREHGVFTLSSFVMHCSPSYYGVASRSVCLGYFGRVVVGGPDGSDSTSRASVGSLDSRGATSSHSPHLSCSRHGHQACLPLQRSASTCQRTHSVFEG